MRKTLTPLKFSPILKEKVWGGTKLSSLFGKNGNDQLGESWEISGVEGNISIVSGGVFDGHSLQELIDEYEGELLGNRVFEKFGRDFPLLFKFIDAKEDLSIQVHPDDKVAAKRHNSFGKTEMWYILQADKDARLILGFQEGVDKSCYLEALSNGTVSKILQEVPVNPGDAFYLTPGTVHAIGGGIVLAEIQQSSDITYRIYDWDRPDTNGNMRELHVNEAQDIINYSGYQKAVCNFSSVDSIETTVCESPFFHTSKIHINGEMLRSYDTLDSFVVYMCIQGSIRVIGDFEMLELQKGESILIPACIDTLNIEGTEATILEVFIPQTSEND